MAHFGDENILLIWLYFKERSAKNLKRGIFNDIYQYFSDTIKAYVVGTHFKCLNLLRQVEAIQIVPTSYASYKEVDGQ